MERRQYGENFYGRQFQGSPFFNPNQAKAAEDELVARSKEWINRQDRDRDQWRRSVDDFLDDRASSNRYHKSRDRSRERSRSRERVERKDRKRSRDRSRERESRRWTPEDDDREGRRRYDRDGGRRGTDDRKERHGQQEWSRYWGEGRQESSSRRYSRDDEEEKKWSSDDEMSLGGFDRMENDFDKPYSDFNLRPEDRYLYRKQTPQRTIIIRGLAQHITEQDIQDDITLCHLVCKDIRLVRRKDTGISRGFAFVEFSTIKDAIKWIELKQGELMLKDHFRALLQYSFPKDYSFGREKYLSDWYCKCQAHNFRRRNTCFKCNLSRKEVEVESIDKTSAYPTNTVLLSGLDTLTTEENVLHSIKSLSSLPIRSVRVGRDITTNTSRGVCYLEMNSVVDAMYLHNALHTSTPVIDGRTPIVSYARLDPVSINSSSAISIQIANAAVAAAQWSHQKSESSQYKISDVPRLAEYSASLYATNPQEKASYLAYYEDYYRKQITDGENISLPVNSTSGLALAQAAVAAHKKAKDSKSKTPLTEAPDGSGDRTYPAPDVSSYQYDKSSGYYYDPYTTLYYDANSQYYYNNKLGKFLYWDASKNTYLPSPTEQSQPSSSVAASAAPTEAPKEDDKKAKEKDPEKDKVKVAKRIARDMERWAKTLNQKKEIAKQNIVTAAAAITNLKAAGAADIGYAVLERKDLSLPLLHNGMDSTRAAVGGVAAAAAAAKNESLVAAYGQGSDSEEEVEDSSQEDKLHTDWSKLACLLCKRQFASKDALVKHQQLSDLHKQNLSAWYKSKGLDPEDAQTRSIQYRDRARERRMKYCEPDTPQPSKLKETYMKSREATINYEEPTRAGIGADNLGNKLLQKMGWQEGMGLGKSNQGRTSIIQTERRSACAGLGTKSVGVTPGPGETYKDCVKKMMQIRYSEIDDPS